MSYSEETAQAVAEEIARINRLLQELSLIHISGNVLDKSVESQRIVETLERIGYTEDEIEAFIKNWGGQK